MDLRESLEEEGYDAVGETGRGDAVIDLVRETQPDLAILDIKMPGADGLEAARTINAERLCGVLMLTAFSQREVVEEARDAGALAFLVKPFQKSDLVPAIEVAMGRFRERRAVAGRGWDLGAFAHGGLLDERERCLFGHAVVVDELALGPVDRLARFELFAERIIAGTLTPPTD